MLATQGWVDPALSDELPVLRAQGEGQNLEYKTDFPRTAQDLGREVAAFATSGGGRIVIGVADNGELLGIDGTETAGGRDSLSRRVLGVCRGSVKPAVIPEIVFAIENEKTVMIITVHPGSQPVYYYEGRPYIRSHSESRPAEPHEVVELVKRFLITSGLVASRENNASVACRRAIKTFVVGILIQIPDLADVYEGGMPVLHLRECRYWAGELRYHAFEKHAEKLGLRDSVLEVVKLLDDLGHTEFSPSAETWTYIRENVASLISLAERLLERLRNDPSVIVVEDNLIEKLNNIADRLIDFVNRIDDMISNGRIGDVLNEAVALGHSILEASLPATDSIGSDARRSFIRIGRELRQIRHMPLSADNGTSQQLIVNKIRQATNEFRNNLAGFVVL
jgi:ATP-dependent DNA helicase RecG